MSAPLEISIEEKQLKSIVRQKIEDQLAQWGNVELDPWERHLKVQMLAIQWSSYFKRIPPNIRAMIPKGKLGHYRDRARWWVAGELIGHQITSFDVLSASELHALGVASDYSNSMVKVVERAWDKAKQILLDASMEDKSA